MLCCVDQGALFTVMLVTTWDLETLEGVQGDISFLTGFRRDTISAPDPLPRPPPDYQDLPPSSSLKKDQGKAAQKL